MADSNQFNARDEQLHRADPGDMLWNESWFFSWMPHDGGPAAFFRLGLLPNQGRGWLWFFLNDGDEWLCFEETRLNFDHFDTGKGVQYDRWALAFGHRPIEPLQSGEFHISGIARVQGGRRAGLLVPVSVRARLTATGPCFATSAKTYADEAKLYEMDRFEQSVMVEGNIELDGRKTTLACAGHRDRSWGNRQWRIPFVNADLHGEGIQIYWGAPRQPIDRMVRGYVRQGEQLDPIVNLAGRYAYTDRLANLGPSTLTLTTESGQDYELNIRAVSDAVHWNMAHTGEPWDNWPYWRTRIAGQIAGDERPLYGWLDASHYGIDPDN